MWKGGIAFFVVGSLDEEVIAADALADPRVELRHGDVADVLREGHGGFDAILLDVDNGAAPLTTRGNAGLYRAEGIRRAAAALRAGSQAAAEAALSGPSFVYGPAATLGRLASMPRLPRVSEAAGGAAAEIDRLERRR